MCTVNLAKDVWEYGSLKYIKIEKCNENNFADPKRSNKIIFFSKLSKMISTCR